MKSTIYSHPAGMTLRRVHLIRIADFKNEHLHPEKLMVSVDTRILKYSLDIGSLCYLQRESTVTWKYSPALGKIDRPNYVNEQSFVPERRELIRLILDEHYSKGSADTSFAAIFHMYRTVIDWCDRNNFSDCVSSKEQMANAYHAYSQHLKDRILVSSDLTPNTATQRQRQFKNLIQLIFGAEVDKITRSAVAIRSRNEGQKDAPYQRNVSILIDACLRIATQIGEGLVHEKPFPIRIDFDNYTTYIFHASSKFAFTPYTGAVPGAYNIIEGRLSTIQEFIERYPGIPEHTARGRIEHARKKMEKNNIDLRNYHRMKLARMVMYSYATIFLFLTGANLSQFLMFEHGEALDIDESLYKKDLTGIKLRAMNKVVRYPIGGRKGLSLLKKYLTFRSWLTKYSKNTYLFFDAESIDSNTDQPLAYNFMCRLQNTLSGTFIPEITTSISASMARLYKSTVLHQLKISPTVVAASLNHSESINRQYYTQGSPESHVEELSNYWAAIKKATEKIKILPSSESFVADSAIATGHCVNLGNPAAEGKHAELANCETQFGCLYCKHYVCHSDEVDIHKLISLKYVALELRNHSINPQQTERLFHDLSVRIDLVLEKISSLSPSHQSTVTKIQHQVFNLGVLTAFWENRLQRYESMGILIS